MKTSFFRISYLILMMFLGLSGLGRSLSTGGDTFLEVTPGEISFKIDADSLVGEQSYYEADRPTQLITSQRFLDHGFWSVGIRAAGTHLVDIFHPANRIPLSQLRWSKDGIHFNSLSNQWTPINTYWDAKDVKYTETIRYRIYSEGTLLLPGTYSVQLLFDARLQKFPWSP